MRTLFAAMQYYFSFSLSFIFSTGFFCCENLIFSQRTALPE